MEDLDILLDTVAAGDVDAFARWMSGAEHVLRRSLSTFAASVDVEVVVQETLLRVWQIAPEHEPDGSPNSLLRLACRIARNLAIDETRKWRPELVDPQELDFMSQDAVAGDAEADPLLRRAIEICLSALKGKPGLAMRARLAGQGDGDPKIAAGIGMAADAFRQNVARARRALRECLLRRGISIEEYLR